MPWLENILGPDVPEWAQWTIFIVVILVTLMLVLWLFRKIFGGASSRLSKSRQPRLSVTDAAVVDDKRRLVLVRRDNVEHLIMIGGPTDIVIEQSIVKTSPVVVPATQPHQPAAPQAAAPERHPEPPPVAKPAKVEPDNSSLFASNPIKSTAAVGGAALAGAGALAVSAKDQAVETASQASEATANMVAGVSESVSQTAETVKNGLNAALDVSADSAQTVGDLDAELTANLDEALSAEAPSVDTSADKDGDGSKTEDEMQRLLKELAAGN